MSGYKSRTSYLHAKTYENNTRCVREHLKSRDIDVDIRDNKGRTALFYAVRYGRFEIANILVTSGCNPDIPDCHGNTPLHEAAEKCDLYISRMLISKAACHVNHRNSNGQTTLMRAVYYDYLDITKLLVNKGADMNIVDGDGKSALLIGLEEGSQRCSEFLLALGCDMQTTCNDGRTALYTAIHSPYNKTLHLAKALLNYGYNSQDDVTWLYREEKHNLFYQDDNFYSNVYQKSWARKQGRMFNGKTFNRHCACHHSEKHCILSSRTDLNRRRNSTHG